LDYSFARPSSVLKSDGLSRPSSLLLKGDFMSLSFCYFRGVFIFDATRPLPPALPDPLVKKGFFGIFSLLDLGDI
jgi:hypothetical protein